MPTQDTAHDTGSARLERLKKFWPEAEVIVDPEDGKECYSPLRAARYLGVDRSTVWIWGHRNCRWLKRRIATREFVVMGFPIDYYVKDDLDKVIEARKNPVPKATPRRSLRVQSQLLAGILKHFNITNPSDPGQYAFPFADTWGVWISVDKAAAEYGFPKRALYTAVRKVDKKHKKSQDSQQNIAELIGPDVRAVELYGTKCHVRLIPCVRGFRLGLALAYLDSELKALKEKRTAPEGVFTTGELVEKYPGTSKGFWEQVFEGHRANGGKRPTPQETFDKQRRPAKGMLEGDADKVYSWLKGRMDRAPRSGIFRNPGDCGRVYLHPTVVRRRLHYIKTARDRWRLRVEIQESLKKPVDALELGILSRKELGGRHPSKRLSKSQPTRIYARGKGRTFWLAQDDLETLDKYLETEPTRPKHDQGVTVLPLPAIVELGIPEAVWEWYAKRNAARLKPKEFSFTIKAKSGRRLLRRLRHYWREDLVRRFQENAKQVANAGQLGTLYSAKQIITVEGISSLHDRIAVRKFLALCAENGWIRRERVKADIRTVWGYDYGQYKALMTGIQTKTPADTSPRSSEEREAIGVATPIAATPGDERHKGKPRRGRGRPSDTDPREDQRVFVAWKTREHRNLEDLAKTLGITKREARLAIWRHKDRLKQEKKREQKQVKTAGFSLT